MNAPRSMPVVPSQTRWEMMRLISQAITRSTLHRSVTSMPISFSTASARRTLLAMRRQVVGAVGERDDLVVVAVLAQLLEAGVQVADVRDAALDRLAVELEHQPQHAVRRGVLRADVDQHVLGAEVVVGSCRRPRSTPSGTRAGRPSRVQARGGERDISTVRVAHFSESPARPRASRSRMSAGSSSNASAMRQLFQGVVRFGIGGERLPGLLRAAEVAAQREVLPQRIPLGVGLPHQDAAQVGMPGKTTPNMSNTSRSSQSAPRQRSHDRVDLERPALVERDLDPQVGSARRATGAGRPPRAGAPGRGSRPR